MLDNIEVIEMLQTLKNQALKGPNDKMHSDTIIKNIKIDIFIFAMDAAIETLWHQSK